MTDKKKADQQASLKKTPAHHNSASTEGPSKIARVLAYLLNTGPLNRFEAERIGDHCLHSTISRLAHGYGLTFKRTPEKVPNHWGQPCDVIRYSLPRNERRHAREVLALLTGKKARRAAA